MEIIIPNFIIPFIDILTYCSILELSFTSEIATAVFPFGFCDRGVLPSNDIYCSCFFAGVIFLYLLFCILITGCLYVDANKTSLFSIKDNHISRRYYAY